VEVSDGRLISGLNRWKRIKGGIDDKVVEFSANNVAETAKEVELLILTLANILDNCHTIKLTFQ
jgi:hypothetical protein